MKKKDLKNGMKVKIKNERDLWVVEDGRFYNKKHLYWIDLSMYSEDLYHKKADYEIEAIYSVNGTKLKL